MTEHKQLHVDPAILERLPRAADNKVVKAITGRSLMQMIQGEDDGEGTDRILVLAFYALRDEMPDASAREVFDLALEADVFLEKVEADPTNGNGAMPLPLSAITGIASPPISTPSPAASSPPWSA